MGRQRTLHHDLPKHLYKRKNSYYFSRSVGGIQTVVSLGTNLGRALEKLPEMQARLPKSHFDRRLRERVFARDLVCVYCGAADSLEVDHFIPTKLGGAVSIRNLVVACRQCNVRKGDQHPLKWILTLLDEARK